VNGIPAASPRPIDFKVVRRLLLENLVVRPHPDNASNILATSLH
jgi:hypothetical protein